MANSIQIPILYDWENIWVDTCPIADLKKNIQKSLKKVNSNFFIRKRKAFGSGSGHKVNEMRNLRNDFEIKPIPTVTMKCDEAGCSNVVVHGNTNQEQMIRKTDIADKYIMKELHQEILEGNKNILVISSDIDFIKGIKKLNKIKDVNIMIATRNITEDSRKAARRIWSREKLQNGREQGLGRSRISGLFEHIRLRIRIRPDPSLSHPDPHPFGADIRETNGYPAG